MPPLELTLLVPGLFGLRTPEGRAARSGLALDALERLLARAQPRRLRAATVEAGLFELFGIDTRAAQPPVAPLTWLHDAGTVPQGYWLRADPVHLQTGLDRLTMACPPALEAEEAHHLCTALNAHLTGFEGLQLRAPVAGRWYLQLPEAPRARFAALPEVWGRDIHAYLPAGEQGARWRRLLNEIQMLLHQQDVNAVRRAAGRLEINSLWFWGGGELPPAPAPAWTRVWSDEPLAAGLARHAGGALHARPGEAEACLTGSGPQLVVLDELSAPLACAELDTWRARLQALHGDWFAPLERALRHGRIAALEIFTTGPCGDAMLGYHISPKGLRRWWRRPRPLDHYG